MDIPYASKGEKINDSNAPQLKWPLIGGVLMSSDTTRLGPEGRQATYINEKYQNEAGDKISVSKALYPDGYRSISILNNGQEFNQGYRPDGSINYTVTPEQFKKDTMNYLDYTRPIPKGQQGLKGGVQQGVYYVNFPQHSISLKNGSADTSSDDAWDATAGHLSLPLGHAGVMVVDGNGKTQYYEYGRYSKGNLIGNIRPYEDGNWRREIVPNATFTNGEINHEALANALSKQFGEKVELTFVDNADPAKTLAAIEADANNKKRKSYNLATKTCGSAACSVIDAGQSGWENFADGTRRVVAAAANPLQAWKAVGGLRPSAKQGGLEMAGYRTYSSK